jgi:membrane protease YdiL (CAAX protease family)
MTLNYPKAPVIKEGWLRALIFCAAIILTNYLIGLLAGSAIGMSLVPGSKRDAAIDRNTLVTLAFLVSAIVAITLSLVFRRFVDGKPIVTLGLERHLHRNDAWAGLLLSIVLVGLGSLILFFTGNLRWVDARFSGSEFFLSLMLILLLAVGEEFVFRGYLLNNLMESFNKWTALLASAMLFTIAHSFNPNLGPLALINLFLGGILLGMNFIYTKTLWFAIGFHFGWNFLQGYVLGYAVSGIETETMLTQELKGHPIMTGNSFGFEGSIIATVVMLAAIGLLYYAYERKSKNLPTF